MVSPSLMTNGVPGCPGPSSPNVVVRYAAFDTVRVYVPPGRKPIAKRPSSPVTALRLSSPRPDSFTIARRTGCAGSVEEITVPLTIAVPVAATLAGWP